ncbi:unnamed protein product [Chironomus riparius]|uniref:Spaetzle domain-containing protein n=1 Tax=Chironomus riparius TaxID=315576 RepID=A0A9N9RJG2_9DIPT|nr:unnamed protein product [Chironomus riparius]
MALLNYSLPFGAINAPPAWATISPSIHASPHAVNNLYEPTHRQEDLVRNDDYYQNMNGPYRHHHPQQQQQQTQNSRNYLPPPQPAQQTSNNRNGYVQSTASRTQTFGNNNYAQQQPPVSYSSLSQNSGYYNTNTNQHQQQQHPAQQQVQHQQQHPQQQKSFKDNPFQPKPQTQTTKAPPSRTTVSYQTSSISNNNSNNNNNNNKNYNLNQAGYPQVPPGFKPIKAGQGTRTLNVAVLDYDNDEGDDDNTNPGNTKDSFNRLQPNFPVTPIQGPIFLQNDSVPVLPLYAYPKLNNGTIMQIPIWWTALSVALGLNVRGDVIKGVPCVKRNNQLFCPTAGNSYPIDKIENFIDENKALMKRMYGYFEAENEYGSTFQQGKKRKRMLYGEDANPPNLPELDEIFFPPGEGPNPITDAGPSGDSYFSKLRSKRQSRPNPSSSSNNKNAGGGKDTGRVDACESKVEIVTPYWASNSAGKIRAIVNTQHFEQAIHQEVCSKVQTNRCAGECGCEQKYKWHRLLAYDPDNDCKGIFMDWFLFPSCCVCRCNPL